MIRRRVAVSSLVLIASLAVAALSCGSVGNRLSPPEVSTVAATAESTFSTASGPTVTMAAQPTGAVINETAAGGVQLVDYDGGYTLDISAEWFVTGLDPAEVEKSIAKIAEDDPQLAQAIKRAQQKTPATFRLIAFDKNHAHSVQDQVPNFNVGVFRDPLAVEAPMEFLMQTSIENMETQVPGMKIKLLDTKLNVHGVPVGATETEWSSPSTAGRVALYQKDLFFQTKKALVVITFVTPLSTANATTPLFDQLIDGIQLLQPGV